MPASPRGSGAVAIGPGNFPARWRETSGGNCHRGAQAGTLGRQRGRWHVRDLQWHMSVAGVRYLIGVLLVVRLLRPSPRNRSARKHRTVDQGRSGIAELTTSALTRASYAAARD